jgi:translation elongation factor EF-1alpha
MGFDVVMQDMGTLVMGKLESGAVMKGLSLLLMPNRVRTRECGSGNS